MTQLSLQVGDQSLGQKIAPQQLSRGLSRLVDIKHDVQHTVDMLQILELAMQPQLLARTCHGRGPASGLLTGPRLMAMEVNVPFLQ